MSFKVIGIKKYLIFIGFLVLLVLPVIVRAEETICYLCDSSSGIGPGVMAGKICLVSNNYLEATDLQTYANCQNIACSEHVACNEASQVTWPRLKLNVAIPGLEELSKPEGVVVNEYVLTKYIGGVYKFFVGIAGILAVFMIVFGGIQWIFSGGNPEGITKAKETILGAVAGLILAVGSYSILYTINPALVQFKGLPLPPIPLISFPQLVTTAEQIASTGEICPSESQVVDASDLKAHPKITISNVYDKRLMPETKEKLIAAANSLGTYEAITITSMYRDLDYQTQLYECYQRSQGTGSCAPGCSSCNPAAKPLCSSPHLEGIAVDVCLTTYSGGSLAGRSTCNYIKQICNGNKPGCGGYPVLADDQKHLQEIMQSAGFSRYCGEWWHFESTPKSRSCAPGVYN